MIQDTNLSQGCEKHWESKPYPWWIGAQWYWLPPPQNVVQKQLMISPWMLLLKHVPRVANMHCAFSSHVPSLFLHHAPFSFFQLPFNLIITRIQIEKKNWYSKRRIVCMVQIQIIRNDFFAIFNFYPQQVHMLSWLVSFLKDIAILL